MHYNGLNNWNPAQNSMHYSFQKSDFISNCYNFQSERYNPYASSTERETCQYTQTRTEAVAEVVKEDPDRGDVISTCITEPEGLFGKLDLSGWNTESMENLEKRLVEKLGVTVEEREVEGTSVPKQGAPGRNQLKLERERAVGKESLKTIYEGTDEEYQVYIQNNTDKEKVYIAGTLRFNYKNSLSQKRSRKAKADRKIRLEKDVKGLREKKGKLIKERKNLEKHRNDWAKFLEHKQDLLEKYLVAKGMSPALLRKLKHSALGTKIQRFIKIIQN